MAVNAVYMRPRRQRARKVLGAAGVVIAGLALWVLHDLTSSQQHDLRRFDGHEVARLETAMWRSYYEHHPVRLFGEMTELLRTQFRLPFWRSCLGAYYAARSAVVFQRGRSHRDYARALPDLDRYYRLIRRSSSGPFDARRAASLELDWWTVHRERARHPASDLYRALADVQAEIYRQPAARFHEHARLRGEAMLLRDARAESGSPSERDWARIRTLLDESWMSLQKAVAMGDV